MPAAWWDSVRSGGDEKPRVRISSKQYQGSEIDGLIGDVAKATKAVVKADDADFDRERNSKWRNGQQTWSVTTPIEKFLKDGSGPLRSLTPQQLSFVTTMVECMDYREAAKAAGYPVSPHSMRALKANRTVGKALVYLLERRARENAVTQDVVLNGLLKEARGQFKKVSGETDSTPASRVAAWRALGEHLQMFVAKVDVDVSAKVKIVSGEVLDAESWEEVYSASKPRKDAIDVEPEE